MAPVSTRHFSQSASRYGRGRDYRPHPRFDERPRREVRHPLTEETRLISLCRQIESDVTVLALTIDDETTVVTPLPEHRRRKSVHEVNWRVTMISMNN